MATDVTQSVETWLPFTALDAGTGTPRTGIVFSEIDVQIKKASDAALSSKTITAPEFRELGSGVYEVLYSAADLSEIGSFLFVINSNGALAPPAIQQYVGLANVIEATVASSSVTLDTNILTGNVIDGSGNPVQGASVSARVLSAPTINVTSPEIGGVTTSIVSAQTDAAGFFALEVLQTAQVDISIPKINYRRTLTVPSNSTDNLFTIP
jgi:hypothetical protein